MTADQPSQPGTSSPPPDCLAEESGGDINSDPVSHYVPPVDKIDQTIETRGYYWCQEGNSYVRKNPTDDTYDKISENQIMRDLDEDGFSRKNPKVQNRPLSMAEVALKRIQITRRVDFITNICGRQAGYHVLNGIKILCPSGFTMIEAAEGDCSDLVRFWEGLFGRGGENRYYRDQADFMRGWLKAARIALRDHEAQLRGQIVVLAGPKDCGKTFFQGLVTKMLSGRACDPSTVFIKRANFNSVLWGAEHLLMGDEELAEGINDRHPLLPTLKKIVTQDLYPFTMKFGHEKSLPHAWWQTISTNCDQESVKVIPSPEDNFEDKISYLRCYSPSEPFHDGSPTARKEWRQKMESQLPAFLHRMIDSFEIPEGKRASRFMIQHFHHPEVIELVTSAMPFSAFGEMLLNWVRHTTLDLKTSGKSAELYRRMSETTPGLMGTCRNLQSFGSRLGQLAVSEKWKYHITHDRDEVWHIDVLTPFERAQENKRAAQQANNRRAR